MLPPGVVGPGSMLTRRGGRELVGIAGRSHCQCGRLQAYHHSPSQRDVGYNGVMQAVTVIGAAPMVDRLRSACGQRVAAQRQKGAEHMRILLMSLARRQRPRLVKVFLAGLGNLLLVLLTAGVCLACPICFPPDKLAVRGPGISSAPEITDSNLLQSFSPVTFLGFEDRASIATPAHPGTGYELIRYFKTGDAGLPASFWTRGFDHFHFYPAADGGPAIYYDGPIGDSMGMANATMIGRWFRPLPQDDVALRHVIQVATGVPEVADREGAPTASQSGPAQGGTPVFGPGPMLLPGLLCVLAIALLAAGTIRRRRRAQSPATSLGLTTSQIGVAVHEPEDVEALPY